MAVSRPRGSVALFHRFLRNDIFEFCSRESSPSYPPIMNRVQNHIILKQTTVMKRYSLALRSFSRQEDHSTNLRHLHHHYNHSDTYHNLLGLPADRHMSVHFSDVPQRF